METLPLRRGLVTGATGMLGSYIVRRLAARGCEVRALVRDVGRAAWLRPLGAELAQGDIADAGAVRAAAAGCDAVFHAAAVVSPDPDWEMFRIGNVEGTQHVIDACARSGSRLVYVSSTAVYGDSRYERAPVDEMAVLPELPSHDAYGRSKQEAEGLVLRAHAEGAVHAAVVRPPPMYGERDRQFVPRIAVVLSRGCFPLIGGGTTTLPLVHAQNVAEGALLAATIEGAAGRAYNLTRDYPLTVANLVRYAAQGLERHVFAPSISLGAGRVLFRAIELGLIAAGHRSLSQHAGGTFEMLTHDNPFSDERARRELNWRPTIAPDSGVADAFRWWKAHHRSTNATR
ncbi:MAG TPA: NAD-dependent epimerase/dehydratase family protein [Gemmatimonadaceae bacterium]|nr:NAD-dependent epimerase/dehydratase family protein [Gemmatimonadaceae bacterium]